MASRQVIHAATGEAGASEAEGLLAAAGFPSALCSIEARLEDLRAWGEIPFCIFLERLEQALPWGFPDRLVEVDMTVDDLLRFRDVIRSHQERACR